MLQLRDFAERLGLPVLVTGAGLDRDVRWVHVSELRDPTPFLRGGELLLLAGTNLDLADCRSYVRSLVRAGIAGLGVGLTPIFDVVPPELVEACAEHALALLEVPAAVPFLAVSELLYQELAAAETRGLKRLSDAQQALIQAATGSAPIRSVVERLAVAVGGWVVLVDRNVGLHWTAGAADPSPAVLAELDRVARATTPTSAALDRPGERVEVQWLSGPVRSGYALAVGGTGPFGVVERAIIGVAASALSLLFSDPEPEWSAGDLGAAALTAVLAPDEAPSRFGEVSGGPATVWRVVAGRARRTGPEADALVARDLSRALRTPFVVVRGGEVLILLDAGADAARLEAALGATDVTAGISGVHGWGDLGTALDEARRAAVLADLRDASLVDSAERAGLAATVDPGRAGAFSRALLAPLQVPGTRAPHLLPTLRTWLAHHGSWDRTAVALGVHRNTVRHRIAQVEQLLAVDLTDAHTRMELWFALSWTGARDEPTPEQTPPLGE
ncbi:PucR family transcriptional regulator [Blastococcus sp. SYSU D00669]